MIKINPVMTTPYNAINNGKTYSTISFKKELTTDKEDRDLTAKYRVINQVRGKQIHSSAEKYLNEAEKKQNDAKNTYEYIKRRIKEQKILPGNNTEQYNEKSQNGDIITVLYERGKNNPLVIKSIKINKPDGQEEFYAYDLSQTSNEIKFINITSGNEDNRLMKQIKYDTLSDKITVKLRKPGKEQFYIYKNKILSSFEDSFTNNKLTFKEIFGFNNGEITLYNSVRQKI